MHRHLVNTRKNMHCECGSLCPFPPGRSSGVLASISCPQCKRKLSVRWLAEWGHHTCLFDISRAQIPEFVVGDRGTSPLGKVKADVSGLDPALFDELAEVRQLVAPRPGWGSGVWRVGLHGWCSRVALLWTPV